MKHAIAVLVSILLLLTSCQAFKDAIMKGAKVARDVTAVIDLAWGAVAKLKIKSCKKLFKGDVKKWKECTREILKTLKTFKDLVRDIEKKLE